MSCIYWLQALPSIAIASIAGYMDEEKVRIWQIGYLLSKQFEHLKCQDDKCVGADAQKKHIYYFHFVSFFVSCFFVMIYFFVIYHHKNRNKTNGNKVYPFSLITQPHNFISDVWDSPGRLLVGQSILQGRNSSNRILKFITALKNQQVVLSFQF